MKTKGIPAVVMLLQGLLHASLELYNIWKRMFLSKHCLQF